MSKIDEFVKSTDDFAAQSRDKANEIIEAVNNRVKKELGKGLSTNDYTTVEKTKLAGIETAAQKNTVTSVNSKTGAVVIGMTDIANLTTEIGKKVDKVAGKNLSTNDFTNNYKSILDQMGMVKFLGEYPTIATLKLAYPEGIASTWHKNEKGFYAFIDAKSKDAKMLIWDSTDFKWVESSTALTASEVAALYESIGDVERFTTILLNKLNGIEVGAEKNAIISVNGKSADENRNVQVDIDDVTNLTTDLNDKLSKSKGGAVTGIIDFHTSFYVQNLFHIMRNVGNSRRLFINKNIYIPTSSALGTFKVKIPFDGLNTMVDCRFLIKDYSPCTNEELTVSFYNYPAEGTTSGITSPTVVSSTNTLVDKVTLYAVKNAEGKQDVIIEIEMKRKTMRYPELIFDYIDIRFQKPNLQMGNRNLYEITFDTDLVVNDIIFKRIIISDEFIGNKTKLSQFIDDISPTLKNWASSIFVPLLGDVTKKGTMTFEDSPVVPLNPTLASHAASKKYVDDNDAAINNAFAGYDPLKTFLDGLNKLE